MPASPQKKSLSQWYNAWKLRISEARWERIFKNLLHPGNMLSLGFISLLIGIGMQGSVLAGVLSGAVLAVVAPYLLVAAALFVFASCLLTLYWGTHRLFKAYREGKSDCEQLILEFAERSRPEDTPTKRWDGKKIPDGMPTNIEVNNYIMEHARKAQHLKRFLAFQGVVVDDFVQNNPHGPHLILALDGLNARGLNYRLHLTGRIKSWFTHKRHIAQFTLGLLLSLALVSLTVCYFLGFAPFLAPVFNAIIGFFTTAFTSLGWGSGVAGFGVYHIVATVLAGLAAIFGAVNLIDTGRRLFMILYNFLEGFLADPPSVGAVDGSNQAPRVVHAFTPPPTVVGIPQAQGEPNPSKQEQQTGGAPQYSPF